MSIIGHLQKVRDAFPACQVLAYADISTRTILAVSSDAELMQEHYNALCERAVTALNGPVTLGLLSAIQSPDASNVRHVIFRSENQLTVFLQSESNVADAFCCQCDHDIALQAFLDCAHKHLDLIGAGE